MSDAYRSEVSQPAASSPRRFSVAAQERWRASLSGGPAFDPDDDLVEVIDRPAERRKGEDVKRLLAILDELDTGGAGA